MCIFNKWTSRCIGYAVLQRMNLKICIFIGGIGASRFWVLWHFILSWETCIRNNITVKSYYYDIQAITSTGLITANIIPLFHITSLFSWKLCTPLISMIYCTELFATWPCPVMKTTAATRKKLLAENFQIVCLSAEV
jgi:hypothetical protein